MSRQYGRDKIGIVAPTGIAAEGLGGCTIHSFFGIGVPKLRGDFTNMWGDRIKYDSWLLCLQKCAV